MKIKTFSISANIPDKLKHLMEMANNMSYSWHYDIIELFRRLDYDLWEYHYHSPKKLLNMISQEKINQAMADGSFLSYTNEVYKHFCEYFKEDTWFSNNYKNLIKNNSKVAYFSMEFGIDECLPIYSGGLGILAGDHLKSASDLGIPLVAVGLAYRQGYFKQYLNSDGWQQEEYPENEFHHLPLVLQYKNKKPLIIEVPINSETLYAQVWRCDVGRVPLILLDTNITKNKPEYRPIAAQLYGGDIDMRIQQEILIGIGGMKALVELDLKPTVCHMNEGHAAFLVLERIRMMMKEYKLSLQQAKCFVKASSVFTTHTPVPAGNDRFDPQKVYNYLHKLLNEIGLSEHDFCQLGRENPEDLSEPFCMTVLALKMANFSNGVSELHGQVSRKMWQQIWPNLPYEEIPIKHITNGIHTKSWISHDLADLYDLYMGPKWGRNPQTKETWKNIDSIPDIELWGTHERRRERLVSFARKRLVKQLKKRGASASEIERAKESLHPKVLTIGFAKRFATYKRATLIFRDLERLKKILLNEERPVQLIFSGKAHPHDNPGKSFIQQIVNFANQEGLRHKIIFIENYDISVARYMVQGCDIWLNNPRRPLEASGTSGMKAAANGVLNLSVLDGWWCEAYNNKNGWAIGLGEEYEDTELQDAIESNHLYNLLENEVIPSFYKRGIDGIPRLWMQKMKECITTISPEFNTNRMLCDYTENFYVPGMKAANNLFSNQYDNLKKYASWKEKIDAHWHKLKVIDVKSSIQEGVKVGDIAKFEATVYLGDLKPEDVCVELYHGLLSSKGRIINPQKTSMSYASPSSDGQHSYETKINCNLSGNYGYTIRLLPKSEILPLSSYEPKLLTWLE